MPLRIEVVERGENATRGFVVHVHGISMRFAAAIRDTHDFSAQKNLCVGKVTSININPSVCVSMNFY